jgi:hypothetical protein
VFARSLMIVATTSYLLTGQDLGSQYGFCAFAGFITAVSIFTQHLWNLAIGIVTYMILVHPLVSSLLATRVRAGT